MPEEKGGKAPELSKRRNIIVIADEAHRSQYDLIDGLARNLCDSLPNASFIGFTGTPIDEEFEEITEGEELTRKEKLKTKWAALEALVGNPKRIDLIAADLVKHYECRLETKNCRNRLFMFIRTYSRQKGPSSGKYSPKNQ